MVTVARCVAHAADRRERGAAHGIALDLGVEHVGVQQQRDAGLAHHLEQQRLVRFGIERRNRRDVVGRVVKMSGRAARAHQTLHDLLSDAADDAILARVKRHPRPDHRRRGGSAEKSVALDEERARAVARGRNRGRASGVAAADDHHVVIPHRVSEFAGRRPRPGRVS